MSMQGANSVSVKVPALSHRDGSGGDSGVTSAHRTNNHYRGNVGTGKGTGKGKVPPPPPPFSPQAEPNYVTVEKNVQMGNSGSSTYVRIYPSGALYEKLCKAEGAWVQHDDGFFYRIGSPIYCCWNLQEKEGHPCKYGPRCKVLHNPKGGPLNHAPSVRIKCNRKGCTIKTHQGGHTLPSVEYLLERYWRINHCRAIGTENFLCCYFSNQSSGGDPCILDICPHAHPPPGEIAKRLHEFEGCHLGPNHCRNGCQAKIDAAKTLYADKMMLDSLAAESETPAAEVRQDSPTAEVQLGPPVAETEPNLTLEGANTIDHEMGEFTGDDGVLPGLRLESPERDVSLGSQAMPMGAEFLGGAAATDMGPNHDFDVNIVYDVMPSGAGSLGGAGATDTGLNCVGLEVGTRKSHNKISRK